ncbi:MAG: aminotransferase class I/II-fold pyridoxal phosphate-dependent enzyme [Lachnospira sp.]|nr:aminotransferase class I/II-fold pyridoxal phosphate-dependent enzyme [Lachnospira sp.]
MEKNLQNELTKIENESIKVENTNSKDTKREDILAQVEKYSKADYVPMHMPGTKRNGELLQMDNPYAIDITEIDGFDNMHHAESVIKDAFQAAANLFKSEETLYLVNGSSAGILSAICGATRKGDKVLVARNSHCSVYNAILLNELEPVYIVPECDKKTGIYSGIKPKQIEAELNKKENEQIKAVIITSPTYEGNVSDIAKIAKIVHERKIPLIVDEAHGSHFGFHEAFPQTAVECGADLVINSIHKTLPSLTQTALLHINGQIVDRNRVRRYWNMYQTTSPSYLLMGAIDRCVNLLNNKGDMLFAEYVANLKALRERLSKLKNIHLLDSDDISKIVLVCDNGKMLYDTLLKKYHIQFEMASLRYCIAMTSVADKKEYYERFATALEEYDSNYERAEVNNTSDNPEEYMGKQESYTDRKKEYTDNPEKYTDRHGKYSKSEDINEYDFDICTDIDVRMSPAEAIDKLDNCGADLLQLDKAEGKISASMVLVYPPGIPVVNYGEVITENVIDIIRKSSENHLEIIGMEQGEKILCQK